jgi:hypothetical protein
LTGGPAGHATLSVAGVPDLRAAPPLDFDGPGDAWSPEHLLMAAVETCFLFTLRAMAQPRVSSSHRSTCQPRGLSIAATAGCASPTSSSDLGCGCQPEARRTRRGEPWKRAKRHAWSPPRCPFACAWSRKSRLAETSRLARGRCRMWYAAEWASGAFVLGLLLPAATVRAQADDPLVAFTANIQNGSFHPETRRRRWRSLPGSSRRRRSPSCGPGRPLRAGRSPMPWR